jgi:hypothetical protein
MKDLADKTYASRMVALLVASYPNLADRATPEILRRLAVNLTTIFTGKSKAAVNAAMHPETGVVGTVEFLSPVAVNKWFERYYARQVTLPEHRKFLPAPPEPEIPAEERAAGAARLRELANAIRDRRRQEDQKRFGIKPLEWKQRETPIEKLFETLAANLEGKGNAMGDGDDDARSD